MGQDRGAAHPHCGMWHWDSLESDNAGTAGQDEDKRVGVLAAFLLLSSTTILTLATVQHLQLVQARQSCHVCREEQQTVTSRWPPWGFLGHHAQQIHVPHTEPWKGRPPCCNGRPQSQALPWGHTLAVTSPEAPLYHMRAMETDIGTSSTRVPGALSCFLGVLALMLGPGLGKKGIWHLRVLLELGDDQGIPEEEEVPLPHHIAMGHHMCSQSSGSGDSGMGIHCCTGPGSSLQSRWRWA